MNHTRWYSGIDRPVRVGWYERLLNEKLVRRFWWNGSLWLIDLGDEASYYQYLKWRGLTAPHGESNATR